MKVTIRDSQILKTIEPEVLQVHLQEQGWHETGRIYDNAGAIWRLKKDFSDEFEILLPLQQNLGDYAARISDILKTLEIVEERSQIDILSELITNAPNITIQGVVMQIQTPNADKLSGEITILGVVINQLRQIKTELVDHDYILAIKAYQERLPILCTGELIKENNTFLLKKAHNFSLENLNNGKAKNFTTLHQLK